MACIFLDALGEWRASGRVSVETADSGHDIADEVPDVLLNDIGEFFI